jgi:hypothetical protein
MWRPTRGAGGVFHRHTLASAHRRAYLADSAKLSPEIVDRLLDLLNLGLEISGVELLTASGADELRVGLKLSDGFRENVSALLAGNIDGHAIQVAGHAGESITSG